MQQILWILSGILSLIFGIVLIVAAWYLLLPVFIILFIVSLFEARRTTRFIHIKQTDTEPDDVIDVTFRNIDDE